MCLSHQPSVFITDGCCIFIAFYLVTSLCGFNAFASNRDIIQQQLHYIKIARQHRALKREDGNIMKEIGEIASKIETGRRGRANESRHEYYCVVD